MLKDGRDTVENIANDFDVHRTYSSKLLAKIRSRASTSPKKKTGWHKADGQQHDAIIENCVSVARAKQKVASPEIIMLAMVKRGVDPVPSEQWIRDRKTVQSPYRKEQAQLLLASRRSCCSIEPLPTGKGNCRKARPRLGQRQVGPPSCQVPRLNTDRRRFIPNMERKTSRSTMQGCKTRSALL
jgi:hypothetical protein